MESILTPLTCFDGIKDFPYQPNFVDYNGLQMHYIDEGDKNGEIILALHGEPTWSYLYRKFVPILSSKYRFVALFVTLWVSFVAAVHLLARPHMFTLLFVAIWTYWLEGVYKGAEKKIWRFPLLMLIWANTSISPQTIK